MPTLTPSSVDVVTIGAHLLDVHVWPVDTIAPGQSSALVDMIKLSAAGAAAGTAVDLARLGMSVLSLGCIGTDAVGDLLLGLLETSGVDCTCLLRRPGAPTSASVLPIRSNGERPALHVRGANELLVADDIDQAPVLRASFLHLGGPDEMTGLDPARIGALVGKARRAGVVVTADLLRGPAIEYRDAAAIALRDVSYFLPNHDQLFSLTQCTRIADAVDDVRGLGIAATLIVTLGAAGCLIVPPSGNWVHVPAYQVDVVDTTGCGDAFCAGLITGLSEGRTLVEAAMLGNRAAGLVATGLGSDAGIVDRSSLDDERWDDPVAGPVSPPEVDELLAPVTA